MERTIVYLGVIFALCTGILENSCLPASGMQSSDGNVPNLAGRFSTGSRTAAAPGASGSFQQHQLVTRRGRSEDAMILVAPVSVSASLAGFSGKYVLSFLAAPVFDIGDGMQMDVLIGGPAVQKKIFERYFDAGRKAGDRDWIPIAIPIDLAEPGDAYLEIRVSGGPQGDLVDDWLALAQMRMVKNRP